MQIGASNSKKLGLLSLAGLGSVLWLSQSSVLVAAVSPPLNERAPLLDESIADDEQQHSKFIEEYIELLERAQLAALEKQLIAGVPLSIADHEELNRLRAQYPDVWQYYKPAGAGAVVGGTILYLKRDQVSHWFRHMQEYLASWYGQSNRANMVDSGEDRSTLVTARLKRFEASNEKSDPAGAQVAGARKSSAKPTPVLYTPDSSMQISGVAATVPSLIDPRLEKSGVQTLSGPLAHAPMNEPTVVALAESECLAKIVAALILVEAELKEISEVTEETAEQLVLDLMKRINELMEILDEAVRPVLVDGHQHAELDKYLRLVYKSKALLLLKKSKYLGSLIRQTKSDRADYIAQLRQTEEDRVYYSRKLGLEL